MRRASIASIVRNIEEVAEGDEEEVAGTTGLAPSSFLGPGI